MKINNIQILIFVLLFLTLSNNNFVYSQTCENGFYYIAGIGCRLTAPGILNIAYCQHPTTSDYYKTLTATPNYACPSGYTTFQSKNDNIITNSFVINQCSEFVTQNSLISFSTIGNCPAGSTDYLIPMTVTFTDVSRYLVLTRCSLNSNFTDSYFEVRSTPTASSGAYCVEKGYPLDGTATVLSFMYWDFGVTKCPIGYSGPLPCTLVGCPAGYTLNADDKTCDDVNECTAGISGCGQICNNYIGSFNCSCQEGYLLNSNNKTCYPNCNINNGGCSQICSTDINNNNYCSCEIGFILSTTDNETCLYNHFISSIIPSTIKGGEASIIGEFSNDHKDITLSIGNVDCPITFNSSTLIKCNAAPGVGYHNVNLTQNGIVFIGFNKYQYKPEVQTCLNNCNSDKQQGTCNTSNGECNCLKGYIGFDCSSPPIDSNVPSTNSSIDPNTGVTDFKNEQTNFQIYIKYLHELDFNGNKVKSFSLQDKWTLNNTNNNIYKLDQMLSFDLISNSSYSVIGCKVTSIIEEIKEVNGKEFKFGDTTFRVDNGLIKYSISISNYTYSSFLNTLQLELVSSVNNQEDNPNCNSKDTEINTIELTNFNYIKISKNNKIFSGRFINHLISDGKSTFFKTTISKESNSIIISLNLPHFKYNCLIDPDFSLLVSSDFKSSCDSSNNRKWVIPVAVVLSVVGAATLVAISFMIYKKSVTAKIFVRKLKRIPK